MLTKVKLAMVAQRQRQGRGRVQRRRGRRPDMEVTKIWTRLLVVEQAYFEKEVASR